jgi:hypothetical protein
MNRIKRIFASVLCLLILCAATQASEEDEDYYIRIHRTTFGGGAISPRARGLGGAYVALANGASAIYENPAALGAQTNREAVFDLGYDEIDSADNHASLITLNAGGSFNINMCAPEYWPRDTMGNHTGGAIIRNSRIEMSDSGGQEVSSDGAVLAYGRSFYGGRVFGGLSLAYDDIQNANDNLTVNTNMERWEMKAGWIYRPSRQMAVGGTLTYAWGDISRKAAGADPDAGDLKDLRLRWGAAYQISRESLLVGDIEHGSIETTYRGSIQEEHSLWKISSGVEHVVIRNVLTLRGGGYYLTDNFTARNSLSRSQVDEYFGFAGGVSYFRDALELSYNLDIRLTGEVGHFIRLGYQW